MNLVVVGVLLVGLLLISTSRHEYAAQYALAR